ncbi:MAG TPA: gliding motility-associated C-terminal domain-containing protein [Chitinophagaceae bacterium]
MMKQALPVMILLCFAKILPAQVCTGSGHTPSSAILLCGSNSYTQNSIPGCGQTAIPVPCNGAFINMNPTWFKMTCFSAGTLGFVISPHDPVDNFDWQLFDISGRNNDDVFTDPGLFVACNWSPEPGETGASTNGDNTKVCSDPGLDLFSKTPVLIQGHEYLLLVSHRTNLPTGFDIIINGGTASVTDPIEPDLFNARLSCDGRYVFALLNKKMACSTIAPDGSDFTISTGATVIGASPVSCNADGEANFVIITLSNSIPAASYTLTIQNGSDMNTIQDKCGRYIATGNTIPVLPPSTDPALPDSLQTRDCSPGKLKLTFRKPVLCNSIAVNASDFMITGPQPVTIDNITFNCNTSNPQSPTTNEIELHLMTPLTVGGVFQLVLRNGTDGNPIIDECGNYIPPGSSIPFIGRPSVSAAFTYTVSTSCKEDTVRFFQTFPAGVTNRQWKFNNTSSSDIANPVKIFSSNGEQTVQLIVTNGVCSDTATETITLENKVKAAFDMPAIICPEDTLHFTNKSSDNANRWEWSFGSGITSNLQSPAALNYPITNRETIYTVKLTAINTTANCRDSMTKKITVLSSCYIAVPTAFTPNGDGLNDYLHPLNALKATGLVFRVFNRVGQLVFETRDWTRKWDGKVGGMPQGTGVYAWMLSFTNSETGEKVFMKGTTVLIR